MLIITVDTGNSLVTLRLDGRLANREARELKRYWSEMRQRHRQVVLDLRGLTSVDGEGKAFLAEAHHGGDWLIMGAATKAIVGEIAAGSCLDDDASRVSGAVRDKPIETVHAVLGP